MFDEIYPGNFFALLKWWDKARRSLTGAPVGILAADADLASVKDAICTKTPADRTDLSRHDAQFKESELQEAFQGQSLLLYHHALTIAVLRRQTPPAHAAALFLRMWTEEGDYLANTLSVRWKISAAATFADHGATGTQRALGMGLYVLFDMIKLHDSERRIGGHDTATPFDPQRGPHASLAFDMAPYSTRGTGDLDKVMLARLWHMAEEDAVIGPLAMSMLRAIMTDQRSIFARLQALNVQ